MKESLQNIRQIICRATWLRSILVVLTTLISVCGWGQVTWTGSNPFNYYYLKNVNYDGSYLYVLGQKSNNQWFGLTADKNFKTPFVLNHSISSSPLVFSFSSNNSWYRLGEVKGNTTKEPSLEFQWDVEVSGNQFTLSHTEKEGLSSRTRYLHASNSYSIDVPKDVVNANSDNTYNWVLEQSGLNNDTTEYYLYNVGQNAFLTNLNNLAAVTTDKDQAVKIVVNKFSESSLRFFDTNYYVYQLAGNVEAASSSESNKNINWLIEFAGNKRFYLRNHDDANNNYYRYLNANSVSGNCNAPRKDFNNPNRTWMFITENEYENAKPKYSFSIGAQAYCVDLSETNPKEPVQGGGVINVSIGKADEAIMDSQIPATDGASPSATLVTRRLFATTKMKAKATYSVVSCNQGYRFLGWSTDLDINHIVSTDENYSPDSLEVDNSTMNHTESVSQSLYALFSSQALPVVLIANGEDCELKVGESLSFTFSNTSNPYPESSGEFWYELVDNTPTGITNGSPTPEQILCFYANSESNTLTACNAGTAKIRFHQSAIDNTPPSFDIVAKDFEFTINVTKNEPEIEWGDIVYYFNDTIENAFSTIHGDPALYSYSSTDNVVAKLVDSTIVTYNKSSSYTDVSVTSAESYYWGGKTFTKRIEPKKANRHVPFVYNQLLYNDVLFTSKSEGATITPRDDYVNYLISGSKSTEHSLIIHFDGIPDTLSFQYQPKTETGVAQWEDSKFIIHESADGSNWIKRWEDIHNQSSFYKKDTMVLKPTTRYLKFTYRGGANGGHFGNIRVTQLNLFEASPSELNFGIVNVDTHPMELFSFSHANAGYLVTITPSEHFTVEPSSINNTGGDKKGSEYIGVVFQPTVGLNDTIDEYIYISDQIGNKDSVRVIGVTTTLGVPEFTWNPLNRPYYLSPADSTYYIDNVFSSSSNGKLTITSSNEDVAKVEGNRLMIYTKEDETPIEVTITVSQKDTTEFVALTKEYTFTPHKRSNILVPFVMSDSIFDNCYIYSKEVNLKIEGFPPHYVKDKGYKWDATSGIKLGGENSDLMALWVDFPCTVYDEKYIVIEFEGTPDSLFFKYRTNQAQATKNGIVGNPPNWDIYESRDGISFGDAIWHANYGESADYASGAIALAPDTRYIKLAYQGNFAGYYKDVTVSAFDGYCFMKSSDNLYMSRGGVSGTKAVVDEFGIAVRKTKTSNTDNTIKYTHFQQIDNGKYLKSQEANLLMNEAKNEGFIEHEESSAYYYSYNGKFVIVESDSTLGFTNEEAAATRWILEDGEKHMKAMNDLRDKQVRSATHEFGEEVESLAKLRERLDNEDYDVQNITVSSPVEAQEQTEQYSFAQEVDNLTPGLYRLNVKALYRIGKNISSIVAYNEKYDCPVAYAYMEDMTSNVVAKSQISSVYSFPLGPVSIVSGYPYFQYKVSDDSTAYFSNGTLSADECFKSKWVYDNDVYLYVRGGVGAKGKVRIGICAPSNANDSNWLCYHQITLTRLYRKEFTFGGYVDGNWNNGANWEYEGGRGIVPEKMHKVKIAAPAVVKNDNHVGAYGVKYENQGSITIEPTGSLTVREGGFSEEYKNGNHITLKANASGQTGVLRIYPGTPAPEATVEFYSTISNDPNNENWEWQYIGSPITQETVETNEHLFYNCWLYQHDTETDNWTTAGNWGHMKPFRGYAFTRNNGNADGGRRASTGPLFTYVGQLNKAEKRDTTLIYKDELHCENHLANSWTAPIDLKQFIADDFVKVEKTINYYPRDGKGNVIPVAPFTSEHTGDDVLPSMQGFFVKTKAANAKLVLDYERLVWKGKAENKPLQAPARGARESSDETGLLSRICINLLSADSIPDHIYLLEKEGEGFSHDFTEGYDAPKYFVDGLPCIYTYETSGPHLAVSATDDVVGTYLAINTNASQNYTLTFSKVIGEGLGLRDLVTNQVVPITEGMQYAFTAPANSSPILRFVVVEHEETPQWNNNNGTSLEDIGGEFKIWQSGEILSVIGAGSHASLRLYDAAGKLILSEFFNEATAINLNALPTGVYMVQVNDKTEKVLH